MMQAKLDKKTFSALVVKNQETLFHTAKAILRSDEDAEDAVQDDWMETVAQEARLCMYARRPGISPEKSEALRRSIVAGRLETGKPVLLLDWDGDISYLNHRISDHAVWGSALQPGQSFPLQLHIGK